MKRFALFLVLCLPISSFAQIAFGKDATWYYSFSEYGYFGYKKISHISDTTMHNMNWLRFSVEGVNSIRTGPGPNDLVQDTAHTWPDIFLATRNDSVFRLLNGAPYLLYDLSANVGDSWQYAPLDTSYSCMDAPIATVIAKGQVNIDGSMVDYLDLSFPMDTITANGQSLYQISSGSYLTNRIYPKFGSIAYVDLFEAEPNACNGIVFKAASLSYHGLRCFQSDLLNITLSSTACDYYSGVGIMELGRVPLKIYPNPSQGNFKIESDRDFQKLEVYNLSGSYLLSLKPSSLYTLNLDPGLYLLRIEFEDGQSQFEKIQIN